MSPDALVEHRLPGHQTETQAPVAAERLDHGKASAGELGRTDQGTIDIYADLGSLKG